jgi:hydroxymethylglutaryl-CoA lyase
MNKDKIIEIEEVGPRDGLQNEQVILDLQSKIKLIDLLADAGLKRIESSSFVSPKYVPQMADAEELTKVLMCRGNDVIYSSIVPNVKGAERALESGARSISIFASASEAHNKANVNMSIDESMAQLVKVAEKVHEAKGSLRGYIVTSFGCPFQGEVPEETVLKVCDKYLDMGISEISLGDTTGMANPEQVKRLVDKVLTRLDGKAKLAVHFHDTRGMALANIYAALTCGVRIFDSAIGGVGGCPFAPGATGNVATEDLVHMFTCMGYDTGINFDKLIEANHFLGEKLGKQLPSTMGKVQPVWKSENR